MGIVENYFFGSSVWHDRFCTTTRILARLVSLAPAAADTTQLQYSAGCFAIEVEDICASLERAGLVRQERESTGAWSLACDSHMVTLEDVFRCVLLEQQDRSNLLSKDVQNDVDLLLTQAMITINDSICRHLRQFSLDRLKACTTGKFPMYRRRFSNASLDEDFRLPATDCDAAANPVAIPVFLEQ